MGRLGSTELIIILVIVFVVFGAGKLPEIGGALGKGIRDFRSATREAKGAKEDLQQVADMTKIDKA